jgi:glycerol-3-phosphate acyltransferase PlsY
MFLVMVVVFLLSLYITKFVSLSSIIASIVAVIYAVIAKEPLLIIVVSLLSLFVIYRHRANIKRIINKTEPKIKWM